MSGTGGPIADLSPTVACSAMSEREAWAKVCHWIGMARYASGATSSLSPLELAAISDLLRQLEIPHPRPEMAGFGARAVCPDCCQALPPDRQHVLGEDGLPDRLSVRTALGWPSGHLGPGFQIKVDGEPVKHCVAYDRKLGFVLLSDGPGDHRRVDGVVTIERTDADARWSRR